MHPQVRLLAAAVVSVLAAAPALAAHPNASAAANRARGLIDNAAAVAAQRASADAFTVRDVVVDRDGSEHVRFDRSYQGLPVIGGDVVVHSRNGQFKKASLSLKSTERPGLAASIKADEAMVAAGADFQGKIDEVASKGLVVYARGAKPVLAYEIRLRGVSDRQGEADMRYFVDARNGKVLDSWNIIQTAAAVGTGQTLFLGDLSIATNSTASGYEMVDTTRGGGNTRDGLGKEISTVYSSAAVMTDADNNWGNNTESSVASEASDAHYGVAATWDYYKNVFGRNGIFNDGVGVKSIVNVLFRFQGGRTGGNAGWYGAPYKFMAYGLGTSTWYPVVALDVAGHEMTHGVTEATAGLVYSDDAGGLNEAASDIMGTMVEYYANNATDAGDYLIGEKIYRSNPDGKKALRYMFRPGDADGGKSYNCYPAAGFAGVDPHYSSGPANHFYYLLAEGAVSPAGFSYTPSQLVCNNDTTLAGIGRDAAQRIWYRALTVYMTSSTTYPQARTATLNAASDLYGNGSTQYNAVARAWSAVSVN
ncbi:M4 family metallopeptidase [Lysobacter antibioticus]|uniref:Neutral metalloproteinase n=1 Tax=Lysobacter antibioticus TaxID=84531 RepID=A0A0S2FEB8_LYSAN|nr:M4 family metallopeptidase [Lysobacter antibioticus]ALN81844.1 thermolysin metallopeptidase, catalytic domain protein [Lysobacter antibioticus]